MQNSEQNQNPNLHLLDDGIKQAFQGSPHRRSRLDAIRGNRKSNADGEEDIKNEENAPVEEHSENGNNISQTKKTTEEKRYFGMKPKVAIGVGLVLLAIGIGVYIYIKKKKLKIKPNESLQV